MAQPTNTFSTYDAKGLREDLIDAIYDVSPEETPVISNIGRVKCKATFHEWQRDQLAAANKDNANIEGDDATNDARVPTERIGNYTQIPDMTVVISSTNEWVDKAGRESEVRYQLAKGMKELKRDLEAMVVSNNAAVAGNDTTARKMAGLETMIYTNISHGVGGSTPSHTAGAATVAPTDGTQRAFTEALLKTVTATAFTNSGMVPKMMVLPPLQKQAFSTFTGIASNRFQVTGKKQGVIIGAADVYVGDFGNQETVPDIFMRSRTALLLNPEYAKVAYGEAFKREKLAKTGLSERWQIHCELTLQVDNEKAHGKIADLS